MLFLRVLITTFMKFEEKISAIIPAYNEQKNLPKVLKVLEKINWLDEVIVIDDASTDKTSQAASKFAKVELIKHNKNKGKGGALVSGIKASKYNTLLFLDADLVGLTEQHLLKMLAPVIFTKEFDMSLGVFSVKDIFENGGTKLANWLIPAITGQRVIRKKNLPSIKQMEDIKYGVDLLITKNIPKERYVIVELEGLSQVVKEKKEGDLLKAAEKRLKMYKDIVVTLLELDIKDTKK